MCIEVSCGHHQGLEQFARTLEVLMRIGDGFALLCKPHRFVEPLVEPKRDRYQLPFAIITDDQKRIHRRRRPPGRSGAARYLDLHDLVWAETRDIFVFAVRIYLGPVFFADIDHDEPQIMWTLDLTVSRTGPK